MKTCWKCKQEYPATTEFFYRNRRRKDNLQGMCKKCCTAYQEKYQQTEKGKTACRRGAIKYHRTIKGHSRCVFKDMVRRCTDPEKHNYNRYGGRGIKVFWKTADAFIDYVVNVLKIDPRGLQIDRIDNDGNYEPGNIRFVTNKENCQNRYY